MSNDTMRVTVNSNIVNTISSSSCISRCASM